MQKDYDGLIKKEEEKLAHLRDQGKAILEEYVPVISRYVSAFYEDIAKGHFVQISGQAGAFTDDQLRIYKERLKALQENSEKIVRDTFSNWIFAWCFDERIVSFQHKSFISIEDCIRMAIGHVIDILQSYNYPRCQDWSKIYDGFLCSRYPDMLDPSLPDEVKEFEEKYRGVTSILSKVFHEVEKLKEEKRQEEAEQRWDSA